MIELSNVDYIHAKVTGHRYDLKYRIKKLSVCFGSDTLRNEGGGLSVAIKKKLSQLKPGDNFVFLNVEVCCPDNETLILGPLAFNVKSK